MSELNTKVESAKNYLRKWNADIDDQITKNHIGSIFNDISNIGDLADGEKVYHDALLDCCNQLLDAVDIKTVPHRSIMGLRILLNRKK